MGIKTHYPSSYSAADWVLNFGVSDTLGYWIQNMGIGDLYYTVSPKKPEALVIFSNISNKSGPILIIFDTENRQ